MKETLTSGSPLFLENAKPDEDGLFLIIKTSTEYKFRLLREGNTLQKVFCQGCVATISRYFVTDKNRTRSNSGSCRDYINSLKPEDRRIREILDGRDEATLISKLFTWQVLVRFDSLSGRIAIDPW